MAKGGEGQRPRHKKWLGSHGPQPSILKKYRIPQKLVGYLIENLGELTLHGKKNGPTPDPSMGQPRVSVVTRTSLDTQRDSESQVPEVFYSSPLHPPRRTLGRRKATIPQPPLATFDVENEEDDIEEVFLTPPQSPTSIHEEGPQVDPNMVFPEVAKSSPQEAQ